MTILKRLFEKVTGQAPYLATLRRVPDDIIREVAPLPIDPGHPRECIVGRLRGAAFSRGLCKELYFGAESPTVMAAVEAYGGSVAEWERLFAEIVYPDKRETIMQAYETRIAEVV